jgi:ADP-ribosylglycohydrolase
MNKVISDRVYGCLIGGAIGDALGAPAEGLSHEQVKDRYERIEEFEPYSHPFSDGEPGSVTDESTLRQYIAFAIAENNGRITTDEYASVLRTRLSLDRTWVPEEITLKKLLAGVDPRRTGKGNITTATLTAAITPLGVINACDPQTAFNDGYLLASVHHEGIERVSAAMVAAGIAEALSPNASVDDVLEVMYMYAPDVLCRGIDLSLELTEDNDSMVGFTERFYDELLDWRWSPVQWNRDRFHDGELISGRSIEIIPAVTGILSVCSDNPNRTLTEAVRFGRDSDTITSLVGGIIGAVYGASAFRTEWIEQCERANTDLFEELEGDPDANFESMAMRLVDALEVENKRKRSLTVTVDELLEPID